MRPIFEKTKLKTLDVDNKWFVPPMCTYQADEVTGEFNFIHYDHYSAFAAGGFKTIIIESNAINKNGRLSPNDLVLNNEVNLDLYNQMISNVHRYGSKIGVQINHGGELSPYCNKFAKDFSSDEIANVIADFKVAIDAANNKLDVDFIEIHAAHGYFLDQIICNRNDVIWTLEQKQAIVNEILDYALSLKKPVGIRINATDEGNDKFSILNTWKDILGNYEDKLEYTSITTLGSTRNVKLHNLDSLIKAKSLFKNCNLISCGGIDTYDDAKLYFDNGASLVGIGTNSFKNKNILYTLASRNEMLETNVFKTLVRISTRDDK